VRTVVGFWSGSPLCTFFTIKRSARTFPRIVRGRCTAFRSYLWINSLIVALSFRSLSRSAPRPASFQNDSIICDAIRFAAATSLVPVLRNISRRLPSTAGAVNRTCQSFLPAGGGWRNIFRVVQRTGMSNLGSFKC